MKSVSKIFILHVSIEGSVVISPFLTQRTKSKFVFAGPTRTAETLFNLINLINRNMYIVPEQVPTQYGGISVDLCECSPEFTIDDPVTEITVKPKTKKMAPNDEPVVSDSFTISDLGVELISANIDGNLNTRTLDTDNM
ncbi:hypothetical protein ACS0TY_005887 [Phlomoides rotata]